MWRLALLLLILNLGGLAVAQQHHHSEDRRATSPVQGDFDWSRKYEEDKAFSEFNHRMAGFFLLLVGAVVLAQDPLSRRWPQSRYAWPVFLFLPGLYLVFLSDPEAWPVGPVPLSQVLTVDHEVLHHKIFALTLVVLGVIEYARVQGRLRGLWAAFIFPVLAVICSVLLLIHPHNPGVHGPEEMAVMKHIQSQHLAFSVVTVLIAVSKALSEVNWRHRRLFAYAWPTLMVALGGLLMRYTE